MVRIAGVESGSIAEELRLEIGTRVVRINGQRVRDGIDLAFLLGDPELAVETVSPAGEHLVYDIERDPGTPIGLVPEPDKIRECANKCVFCFIDGNPRDARRSLWLRDDDFRLSFTYGSYVTLTNLGPRGLQRLVDQRISPLYVSVHATEPEVRERLLVNRRAGLIMEQLSFLLEGGLEVHTQVVLCPEWNDGAHLDRTVDDLWSLGPRVRSLSVVPVGLTRYNENRPVRRLTAAEAANAIEQVERARQRTPGRRETRWAYAADEMFLIAGMEVPGVPYYDDLSLVENGVGAVRRFLDDLDAGMDTLPDLSGHRIRVVTGRSMAPWIEARAGEAGIRHAGGGRGAGRDQPLLRRGGLRLRACSRGTTCARRSGRDGARTSSCFRPRLSTPMKCSSTTIPWRGLSANWRRRGCSPVTRSLGRLRSHDRRATPGGRGGRPSQRGQVHALQPRPGTAQGDRGRHPGRDPGPALRPRRLGGAGLLPGRYRGGWWRAATARSTGRCAPRRWRP